MRYLMLIFFTINLLFANEAPRPFVDFAFYNLDGQIIDSDIIRENKVLVFKIGQLSCPVCTKMLADLAKIKQDYQDKQIVFLDISLDSDKQALKEHAKKYDVSFDTLIDSDGDLANYFGVSLLPVLVVVSKSDEILYYKVGDIEEAELRTMFDSALSL